MLHGGEECMVELVELLWTASEFMFTVHVFLTAVPRPHPPPLRRAASYLDVQLLSFLSHNRGCRPKTHCIRSLHSSRTTCSWSTSLFPKATRPRARRCLSGRPYFSAIAFRDA